MKGFARILIASYRHRKHNRPGRLYGRTPVISGPRSYTTGLQRWAVTGRLITNGEPNEQGQLPAIEMDLVLTINGRERMSYDTALAVADRHMQQLVDETPGVIDQHFDLFALIPRTEAAAKAKAKARRRK